MLRGGGIAQPVEKDRTDETATVDGTGRKEFKEVRTVVGLMLKVGITLV